MEEIVKSFGIDWKIFFSEVVNFLVVVGVLSYFLYSKVFSIIEERQNKIDEGLRKSEEADQILKKSQENADEIISKAKEEAKEKIKIGIERGEEKKEDIILKAKNEAEKIIKTAKNTGDEEKSRIINSAKDEIAKMVVLGVEKVLVVKK